MQYAERAIDPIRLDWLIGPLGGAGIGVAPVDHVGIEAVRRDGDVVARLKTGAAAAVVAVVVCVDRDRYQAPLCQSDPSLRRATADGRRMPPSSIVRPPSSVR
jgi:hypothetical protein